jgi:hypothetical protein
MLRLARRIGVVPALVILFAAAPLPACVVGVTTSCDFRDSGELRCQERNGLQGGSAFGSTCSAVGGVEASGECPDADQIVGGCRLGGAVSGEVIDWYYAPATAEEIQEICVDDDGEYVAI